MLTADEILKLVNERLTVVATGRTPEGLYEPIRYVLSLGGKRIRPTLMLLAYNLFCEDLERILTPACALETYHNYTLLHDDLMDNADKRRGKPTVHVQWNDNQAILSGDTMLVLAYQMMAESSAERLKPVLDLFTETALEIGDGQQLDMEFEKRTDVTEDEYIEMIRLKTSVLLACALKIGAILAGASEEDADNLYRFGEKIGLAFQLQDDYLDVYGDEKVFGKAIGGDILEGKQTYLMITAISRADEPTREVLRSTHRSQMPDAEKIATIKAVYDRLDIPRLTEQQISLRFERALGILDTLSVEKSRTERMREYALSLMGRKN